MGELSIPLQVAMFLACAAIFVLAVCLIPLAFQMRRHSERLLRHIEELKTNTELLAHDSRELVRNLNDLSRRAHREMDDIDQMVRTVRHWTERADRLVNEVGSVVEPQVLSLVHNAHLLQTGVTGFLRTFMHSKENNEPERRKNDE